MLAAARLAARHKQERLEWVCGDGHYLPFPDRSFDLVTCRAAPHHFTDLPRALAEAARLLRRGGRLGIVDGMVPEDDVLDRFINDLDLLHDATTVRNYRPSEWRAMVERAGLRVDSLEVDVREVDEGQSLRDWIARAGGTSVVEAEARERLAAAPAAVRDYLMVREVEDDLFFSMTRVVLVGRCID
jgi:SAM-dependent methyltransferase